MGTLMDDILKSMQTKANGDLEEAKRISKERHEQTQAKLDRILELLEKKPRWKIEEHGTAEFHTVDTPEH